ncbi:nuclear transport factor 2 family protein [Aquibaculum arenosum]|uniref:Nuclear transport factor 2 family protein n=1 Tax=Aquibaculum arenosum TaxID=3032591 RepID=A0ABT5YPV7_9PROT|nr:nuclear transport factor 2 family protein [Fodinicurvata sp. CAU 1616]MDF2096858.1 nuclear transport factor 2 family protein [Fodinicurvata sp. CAU 1616]
MRERAVILFANDAFYEAFRAGDLQAMDGLWARKAPVACAHPGWAPLIGREAVMESWKAIIENGGVPEALRCREPRVVPLSPESAMVLCYEQMGKGLLLATNVFVQEEGEWRLVHHHAGPTQMTAADLEGEAEPSPLQ